MFTTSDLPPMAPHFQSFFSLFNAPMDEEAFNLSRALALQTLMNLGQLPQPLLPMSLPQLNIQPSVKQITTLEDLILNQKAAEASRLLSENSRKRSFPPVVDRQEAVDCLLHLAEGMDPGVTKEMFDETLQRILDEEINDGRSSCSDSCDNSDRLSPPRALSAFRKVSRLSEFSSVQKELSAVNINETSTLLWQGSLQFESHAEVPVECHLVEDVNRRVTKDHLDQLSAPRLFCTTAQTPESKTRAASELSFASSHSVCVFVPSGNSVAEKKVNGDLLKAHLDNSVGIIEVASKESTMYVFPSASETELAKIIEKSPIYSTIRQSDLTYFPAVLAQK